MFAAIRSRTVGLVMLGAVAVALGACGDTGGTPEGTDPTPSPSTAVGASLARLGQVGDAVLRWRTADTIGAAHMAAEEARNLVTGPDTLGAGDLDGDGVSLGLMPDGLLPGAGASPGLAAEVEDCDAVTRDVLGGSWADPVGRWTIVEEAIDEWSETNNPFPSLPSHPQRIVGWATLTLRTDDLDLAREFAGHAQLHVDVARDALDTCAR